MSTKNKTNAVVENVNLESADAPLTKNFPTNQPDFTNQEWLEKNDPTPFFTKENISSKYEEKREVKIQEALPVIGAMKIKDVSINPLLVLLAKWWEVKPARATIKKMIDAEAKTKGIDKDVYMQINLAQQVDAFSEFQSAIDRIRYSKTYFKPRGPLSDKVPTQQVLINNVTYIVPIAELQTLKVEFAGRPDELKVAVIAISKVLNVTIEEL